MAHPIPFKQANQILRRPESMTAEECCSLEVCNTGDGFISRWQLEDREIEELKRNGGKIYIVIWGQIHPPIAPLVDLPM